MSVLAPRVNPIEVIVPADVTVVFSHVLIVSLEQFVDSDAYRDLEPQDTLVMVPLAKFEFEKLVACW